MAINGAWRASLGAPDPPASAKVWGTGINPVHARHGNGARNVTPGAPPGDSTVPANITDHESDPWGYGPDHDGLFGYGFENGTADRPRLGDNVRRARAQTTPGFPSPGYHQGGAPGGTKFRSQEHGGIMSYIRKALFPRPVIEGWVNKDSGVLNDSVTAADSQLVIQTGAVQMPKPRAGSQRSGSQSEYRAPIASRTRGMKIQEFAGGERHEDMRPRTQTPGLRRPFFPRTAGTGDPAAMRVNATYTAIPRSRTVPPPPDAGVSTPTALDQIDGVNFGGYTDEDPIY